MGDDAGLFVEDEVDRELRGSIVAIRRSRRIPGKDLLELGFRELRLQSLDSQPESTA